MKKVFLILLIISSIHSFCQNIEKSIERTIITFNNIEKPPVFPECSSELTKELKRKCINAKLNELVENHFNLSLLACLEKEYIVNQETGKKEEMCSSKLSKGKKNITIQFVINKTGETEKIYVTAPHPKLQKEGVRIAKMIPKMTPGKRNGKPTAVSYSFPISFNVQ